MLWGSHPEKNLHVLNILCYIIPLKATGIIILVSKSLQDCRLAKKATFMAVHMISASMRNCNKITVLSHTSGWQEVHTVAVLLCHSCGSASAICCHAEVSLLLVVIDTWGWDTLYQRLFVLELLELLSFGPSKHNFFLLCLWATFSKPVNTLVWTVIGANHSYRHETSNGKCNGSKEHRQIIVSCVEQQCRVTHGWFAVTSWELVPSCITAQSSISAILLGILSTSSYCCYLINYSSFLSVPLISTFWMQPIALACWHWCSELSLNFILHNSIQRQSSKLLLVLSVPSSKSVMKDSCALFPVITQNHYPITEDELPGW